MKTPATAFLDGLGVRYEAHRFDYVEGGGTRHSSQTLGVDEHHVVKTLVFEDEGKQPVLVLMHGDRRVSTKALARQLGRKTVAACAPEVAQRHTGYQVGGTSPFGTKKPLVVACERSITTLDRLFINGGGRGFLVSMTPDELVRALSPTLVDCAAE
ncbi:MAG: aminoacyl-tRNA deacylase [Myxococcaceae bacterium]|nr:aminoacyl-tRNA deacylase [Myxococcaceae bacterium]